MKKLCKIHDPSNLNRSRQQQLNLNTKILKIVFYHSEIKPETVELQNQFNKPTLDIK